MKKSILIKTYKGKDLFASTVVKNSFELSKDKFGWTITDLSKNISYSERNSNEEYMFNKLYEENFTLK